MGRPEWRRQLAGVIRTVADLEENVSLYPDERAYFDALNDSEKSGLLPFAITEHYMALIGDAEDDPIRRQAIPRIEETHDLPYETVDPLQEAKFRPIPSLVHRYPSRVLITLTDACAGYCRHCFRRVFAGSGSDTSGIFALESIGKYLSEHPEVREVILSGGDPLTLDNEQIDATLSALRSSSPLISYRIHTRIPAVLPTRIDKPFAALLRTFAPLWVVVQTNHPREITDKYLEAVGILSDAGVPLLNQTVLLRGVNDNADVLEQLFIKLARVHIKPYYLFQGDLAQGTGHLRVSLARGLQIVRDLRTRLSGLECPTYAVDLPEGGGKVDLLAADISGPLNGSFVIVGRDGDEYLYPDEQ